MIWPIVNGRAPIRLEGWWAIVGQDNDDARGALGGGHASASPSLAMT